MVSLRGAVLLDNAGTLAQTHERVARLLKDYNPELDLQYIPEKDRTPFDKPFRVVHHSSRGDYVIGYFAEKDVNHNLVAHVFKHDRRNTDILKDLEAEEAAKQALLMKEQMDKMDEAREMAQTIIRSPLHTYQLRKGRKIR